MIVNIHMFLIWTNNIIDCNLYQVTKNILICLIYYTKHELKLMSSFQLNQPSTHILFRSSVRILKEYTQLKVILGFQVILLILGDSLLDTIILWLPYAEICKLIYLVISCQIYPPNVGYTLFLMSLKSLIDLILCNLYVLHRCSPCLSTNFACFPWIYYFICITIFYHSLNWFIPTKRFNWSIIPIKNVLKIITIYERFRLKFIST